MKKIVFVLLAVFALVLGSSVPGDAFRGGGGGHFSGGRVAGFSHFGGGHFGGHHFGGHHFHRHFGVGFVAFGPWWWDPLYYPYPSPSVVVQSEPEMIVEPQASDQHYWYYCSDPSGYYPYVKQCPKGWLKVVPAPEPPETEE